MKGEARLLRSRQGQYSLDHPTLAFYQVIQCPYRTMVRISIKKYTRATHLAEKSERE
jgi:hypothetical protein